MKNSECMIFIISKNGWTQSYRKKGSRWVQWTNGVKRNLTAEQLLSHMLPILANGNRGAFRVAVVPDPKKEK